MDYRTRANSIVWDSVAEKHFQTYHIDKLIKHKPVLNELIKNEVGNVNGKTLIHLLCHIGTDTLSWKLLGAEVTGVDISTESIKIAQQISKLTQLNAQFIVSDVMEFDTNEKYDIAFASTGVLCWIPDIDKFASIVKKLLKKNGFFYLHEGHPFMNMIKKTEHGLEIGDDYFSKKQGEYETFSDYTDQSLIITKKTYEWDWTIGDIINSFCKIGMKIEFFREYPQFFYYGYPGEVEVDKKEKYPCTFSMKIMNKYKNGG